MNGFAFRYFQLNPPPSEALKRMHMLAADPGIVAVMNKVRTMNFDLVIYLCPNDGRVHILTNVWFASYSIVGVWEL